MNIYTFTDPLYTWTYFSISDVNSQVDVPETAAAYSSHQAVFPANLKLLRTPAPAARS